jgi:hypothetical protein
MIAVAHAVERRHALEQVRDVRRVVRAQRRLAEEARRARRIQPVPRQPLRHAAVRRPEIHQRQNQPQRSFLRHLQHAIERAQRRLVVDAGARLDRARMRAVVERPRAHHAHAHRHARVEHLARRGLAPLRELIVQVERVDEHAAKTRAALPQIAVARADRIHRAQL